MNVDGISILYYLYFQCDLKPIIGELCPKSCGLCVTTSQVTSTTISTSTTRKLLTPKISGKPRDIVVNFESSRNELEAPFTYFSINGLGAAVRPDQFALNNKWPTPNEEIILEDYGLSIDYMEEPSSNTNLNSDTETGSFSIWEMSGSEPVTEEYSGDNLRGSVFEGSG